MIKPYNIQLETLTNIISNTYFAENGDYDEQRYYGLLKNKFPNCEVYWKNFVVPVTKRVEPEIRDQNEKLQYRDGISTDIINLTSYHYSTYINLFWSFIHLNDLNNSPFSFEDFYIHLASACDLAELFMANNFLFTLECNSKICKIKNKLDENTFLDKAKNFFKKYYQNKFENFVSEDRHVTFVIQDITSILDNYFNECKKFKDYSIIWKEYKTHSTFIRQRRNLIVHDARMGKIKTGFGLYIPKDEFIKKYDKFYKIKETLANKDANTIMNEFIEIKEKMITDIEKLEEILNQLWEKPIENMKELFDSKNEIFLIKYNLNLI